MSVQITDCTIRDGGYLLNKNSPPDFVKGVMKGLADSGIDFVETGYLQDKVNGESLVYHNSIDARKYIPSGRGRTEFLGFCDNSRYSPANLDEWDGNSFKWLRISFAKHELEDALNFCTNAQDKGYIVQFNPMDALSYSDSELERLIRKVNSVRPGSVSIVDTFGAMYLDDLTRIFRHIDSILDRRIKIGFHSHNNLGLSCALSEMTAILAQESGRDVIIDGSLLGMARGAGNAQTELLADFLNKKFGADYDIPVLIETLEKYIAPFFGKVRWGYDLPMFICGIEHSHVDNIYYMQENTKCSAKDMYRILEGMPLKYRIRYRVGYRKSDFTELEYACSEHLRQ